jgi:glycosyltransferase involved in cell wall biosynthesis
MHSSNDTRQLKIALLGTRGIPARYGGFETFAEELARILVRRGHAVTVYGRRAFFGGSDAPQAVDGVGVRLTPTIRHKYLETPLHAASSFLDLFRRDFDLVLLCNAANSPCAWLGRLRGLPIAINVDGIERRRSKWNAAGRLWYRLGELCSVLFATRIVSDADVIARYYRESYGASSEVIAYGARAVRRPAGEMLSRFGLSPKGYILYVSRLEPENNALGVVQAYRRAGIDMPLVIVGDAPYAPEYIARVKSEAPPGVIFTGYQFAEAYQELQSHPLLYIQATEVGGTHPALIEAMAYGNCVIANGTPENLEVLGGAGEYYYRNDFDHLALRLRELCTDSDRRKEFGEAAKARAQERFSWEAIADRYEGLLRSITK